MKSYAVIGYAVLPRCNTLFSYRDFQKDDDHVLLIVALSTPPPNMLMSSNSAQLGKGLGLNAFVSYAETACMYASLSCITFPATCLRRWELTI